MEINEKTFDTGTVLLNYAEIPSSGTPLVLLHGGNARWQGFGSILSDLSDWPIYAPDLRGHGQSGRVPKQYRLQDYTDDIIAFLRAVVREPAYLFGHSLGGIVASMVASQYPSGVRALVVGDAPLSRQTWQEALLPTRDRLSAWRDLCGGRKSVSEIINILKDSPVEVPGNAEPVPMRNFMGEESPVYEWLAINLFQSDPDMLTAILEHFEDTAAGYELNAVLPAIHCPVLLLQADPNGGGIMTDAEVQQALPLLAKPSHVRLEGVSHVLHNDRKEPVMEALKAFLQTA